MFGTIRKHQTWLWGVVITLTIISMVVMFSPTSQFSNQPGGPGNFGSIDGVPVTPHEFENAYREAHLGFFLNYGLNTKATFDKTSETYHRLFLIQKLKEFNLEVDADSVAKEAKGILFENGVTLDKLLQAIGQHVKIQDTDFERYIRHNLGAQQLMLLVGLSGDLVTPQEARMVYIQRHQEISTEAVFFSGSNYLADVTAVPPEALARFYTNQEHVYTIPNRVQVSYVRFELTNFLAEADRQLAEVTNLNYLIEQDYRRRGTNYFRDAKSPEEAMEKIRWEYRSRIALGAAHKKANVFLKELFDLNPLRAENLAGLAKTNGLVAGISQPFDATQGPAEFDGGPNFARAAFQLTAQEPFAEQVLVGDDSTFVIALDKRIPSELPPLDRIRDRVVADYKYTQAESLARMAGLMFAQRFTNGLPPAGKTFAGICAEARVKPVRVPPFSLSTTNPLPQVEEHVSLRQYASVALVTMPGKVSDFSSTRDGGFAVYVEKRLPVDEAKMTAEMPGFLTRIRQARRQEAFYAWFNRESSRALREVLRPNPPPGPGQGRS